MSRIILAYLLGLFLFTEPIKCQTPPTATTLVISGQKEYTWTNSDVEEGTNPFIFQVPEGYFISVTVSDVDMSDGNFLRIEAGTEHQQDATEGRVFANSVRGPYKYLFKTNTVNAFCQNTRAADPLKFDFNVKFEQAGEITTTVTTTPTTTVNVPPTEPEESVYVTVNVNGRYLSEYNQAGVREAFQSCVVDIATRYCQEQNINLLELISTTYVMIANITQCPYNWPDSTKCVQITFKLPVFHDGTGYQLSSEHLSIMWLRKDELDDRICLRSNNFADYDEPDVERSIVWWAVGISLVIAAFVILMLFLRTFSSKVRPKKGKGDSDTRSIMSSKRSSVSSLTPHYLQDHLDTPKFFDS